MSDQDRIFPYNIITISLQYQADKWLEWRQISIKGLPVDPIPNFPIKHHKTCMADSKESYLWELRSFKKGQRIICTPQIIFVTIIIIIFCSG